MDSDRRADRAALQELKARYFRFLDTKQWASWRELFTDDMVFFNDDVAIPTSTEPMTRGGDDFVEMVSSVLAHAVTVHQGHMPELRFVDERNATGVWAMFDWVDSSGSDNGSSMQGFGHYHEHYRKGDDGQWRIAELRLTRLRVDTSPPTGAVTDIAPWIRPVAAG